MIVCHCTGVTDRELVRETAAGRGRACQAGSFCGGCKPLVERILAQASAPRGGPAAQAGERPAVGSREETPSSAAGDDPSGV